MEAKELRIGNLIRLTNDLPENYMKVLEVGETMKCYDCDESQNGYWDLRDFSPIPLTPEILEKCGFEKKENLNKDFFCLPNTSICLKLTIDLKFMFLLNGRWMKNVTLLHDLQNTIFALTGEELTIKL